ncbi:hypothetical protein DNTS_024111 [Danionella cerebrum]|uniref:BZIP domain-containing protein n=1 Tax=Danionella cerebrum TaxID=2873325 RepID=A0A553QPP0_9TELE|nr:hypothetical protein DNTS_024111 [Danionella translucida]
MSVQESAYAVHNSLADSSGSNLQMNMCLEVQPMIGFPKPADSQSLEPMMDFLPYNAHTPTTAAQHNGRTAEPGNSDQQYPCMKDFASFLLPPPVSVLRLSEQKRGLSKDSMEYRLRRERNNIAVRKSRDKARRRVQLTQQRAMQLQDENQRLHMHIQHLSNEVEALRVFLSQRHLQPRGPEEAGEEHR